MKYYVNAEATWSSDFIDNIDVPDSVVALGEKEVRAYIKELILCDMRDYMELNSFHMSIEQEEEEEDKAKP